MKENSFLTTASLPIVFPSEAELWPYNPPTNRNVKAINSVRQVVGMIAVAITCLPRANFKTELSVVGQFEFLASCVTIKKIQTDPLPIRLTADFSCAAKLLMGLLTARKLLMGLLYAGKAT